MKKLLFMVCVVSLAFSACTSDEPLVIKNNRDQQNPNVSTKIDLQTALNSAEKMMSSISSPETRSVQRTVKSVSVITNRASVRSETSDTLLYIVNYDDEQGFAILGADTRVEPVYAISDVGHFEITDETNYGMRLMMYNIKKDAAVRTQSVEGIIDPSFPPLYEPKIIDQITPMLSERQSRMGVDNCSQYTVNDDGEPALTCCVPIAAEMVMSYYHWPETIRGINLHWNDINAGDNDDELALLIAILSDKYHFHVRGNTASYIGGCFPSEVYDGFVNSGYFRPHDYIYWVNNETTARSELSNGPLYMSAYAPSSSPHNGSGHAWVIDGMIEYEYWTHKRVGLELVYTRHTAELYHCVWGDKGSCNGYYYSDSSMSGEPVYIDPNDSDDFSSAEYRDYERSTIRFIGNFQINPFFYNNVEEIM